MGFNCIANAGSRTGDNIDHHFRCPLAVGDVYLLEHAGPLGVVRFCGDHLDRARWDEWSDTRATSYPSREDAEEAQRCVGGVIVVALDYEVKQWASTPAVGRGSESPT